MQNRALRLRTNVSYKNAEAKFGEKMNVVSGITI
jgi:hypothetical protein